MKLTEQEIKYRELIDNIAELTEIIKRETHKGNETKHLIEYLKHLVTKL